MTNHWTSGPQNVQLVMNHCPQWPITDGQCSQWLITKLSVSKDQSLITTIPNVQSQILITFKNQSQITIVLNDLSVITQTRLLILESLMNIVSRFNHCSPVFQYVQICQYHECNQEHTRHSSLKFVSRCVKTDAHISKMLRSFMSWSNEAEVEELNLQRLNSHTMLTWLTFLHLRFLQCLWVVGTFVNDTWYELLLFL